MCRIKKIYKITNTWEVAEFSEPALRYVQNNFAQ